MKNLLRRFIRRFVRSTPRRSFGRIYLRNGDPFRGVISGATPTQTARLRAFNR